jgi:hypothetical protein
MLKHRRESRLVHCLICWKCGGRAGPNHYVLEGGGATCSLCGDKNPLGNLRRMPLESIRARFEIVLCFVPRDGVSCHALHVDCRTVLGPWVHVTGDETVLRMLTYLGATKAQLAEYEDHRRQWGQGSVHVSVLGGNRRNLLKIDWSKL